MRWELPEQFPPAEELARIARSAGVGIHPLRSGTVLHGEALIGFERRVLLGYVHLTPAQIHEGFARIAGAIAKGR
jgi:DNA-binding transcriptional MocR family regulator